MTSDTSATLLDVLASIRVGLYLVFAALCYLGFLLTAMFLAAVKKGKSLQAPNVNASREFQQQAAALLNKGQYEKLKEVATAAELERPGDASVVYYLGLAHFRSRELVPAKRCFERVSTMDATLKKIVTNYLAEIEVSLKNAKPTLVDTER